MEILDKLYINDDFTSKEINNIMLNLAKRKNYLDVFCICFEEGSKYPLEMLESKEIIKDIYDDKQYIIVGISKSEEKALEIIKEIIDKTYRTYGDVYKVNKLFI